MASKVRGNDGKVEVFTLEGPLSVASMAAHAKASKGNVPIMYQTDHIELTLKEGQFFHMDGEPWFLNAGCRATVQRNTQVRMLCPPQNGDGAGHWSGHQKRNFWEKPPIDSRRPKAPPV